MHDFKEKMNEILGPTEQDLMDMQAPPKDLQEMAMHMHGNDCLPVVETVDGFHVIHYFDPLRNEPISKLGLLLQEDFEFYITKKLINGEHVGKLIVPGNGTIH